MTKSIVAFLSLIATLSLFELSGMLFGHRHLFESDDYNPLENSTFTFLDFPYEGKVTRGGIKMPNMGIDCELKETGHLEIDGHTCNPGSLGNLLSSVYLSALRAFQHNNTFTLHCNEDLDDPGNVIPHYISNKVWFMNISERTPDLCKVCKTWPHNCRIGLNFAVPMIRETLRRIPPPSNMDDVTLHFRCGDILNNRYMSSYGYPSYRVYKEHLAPFSSIGILTSSFDEKLARPLDAPFISACKQLVEDMAEYFQETFPDANVTIHTEDTIEESVGRLVHSKQIWCNPSTFCVFPAIATTGQAFILKSELYPFVENIRNEPNITLVEQGILSVTKIATKGLSPKDIIHWLRSIPE
jgi:hypothetical protein